MIEHKKKNKTVRKIAKEESLLQKSVGHPPIFRTPEELQEKAKDYLVEVKRPKTQSENIKGVAQLLDYGLLYLDSIKETELVLVTTMFDMNTARVIKHYKLPIRYIYFSKDKALEFKDEFKLSRPKISW